MKHILAIFLVLILVCSAGHIMAQRQSVYDALSASEVGVIDEQLKQLEKSENAVSAQAYSGALLMKKAGLVKGPSNKLSVFKDGREKLEAAIEKEQNNGEFRFLRLMIQENAPDILGYNKNLEEDAAVIKGQYDSFPDALKKFVQSYSSESKTLKSILN